MASPVPSPHHAELPSQSALTSPSLPGEPARLDVPNQIIKHELQSPLMVDGVPLSHQTSQTMHPYVNHRTDLEPPGRHTDGPGGDCWLHGGPHQEKWTSRQPSFVPQGLMMDTYPRYVSPGPEILCRADEIDARLRLARSIRPPRMHPGCRRRPSAQGPESRATQIGVCRSRGRYLTTITVWLSHTGTTTWPGWIASPSTVADHRIRGLPAL